MNLKLTLFSKPINKLTIVNPRLHFSQLLSSQPQSQLVAPPLVLEPIDAPQGLSHGNVENKMGQGKQSDGSPAVAALETSRLNLSHEDKA